jgi:hypothetical protein
MDPAVLNNSIPHPTHDHVYFPENSTISRAVSSWSADSALRAFLELSVSFQAIDPLVAQHLQQAADSCQEVLIEEGMFEI